MVGVEAEDGGGRGKAWMGGGDGGAVADEEGEVGEDGEEEWG